jgi:small subunit ribosomal protein S6
MRNYEVVLIVHPDLDETALTGVVDKVKGWITDSGGSVLKADVWGKRRMAYRMNKQREGQYVYMVAAFEPKYNVELERNLRFTEPVMRFLVTARLKPLADGE